MIRTAVALMISPALMITGFRFSKDYRHGLTLRHRIVYRLVNTIAANHYAWKVCGYPTL